MSEVFKAVHEIWVHHGGEVVHHGPLDSNVFVELKVGTNVLKKQITLKMKAVYSSKFLVSTCKSTRRPNPQDQHEQSYSHFASNIRGLHEM